MLCICQRGGLANRLLTVLSHVSHERSQQRSTLVFWPSSRDFNGTFEECFQPVDGMIQMPVHPVMEYADIKEFTIHPLADWSVLKELQPSDEVASLLPEGQYDAVHIRRTDLSEHIRKCGWAGERALEEYDRFIEDSKAPFVWLATDNAETQARMLDRHGDRVRVAERIVPTGEYRQTRGVVAAADLLACGRAERLLGSRHSTFSNFAVMLSLQVKY